MDFINKVKLPISYYAFNDNWDLLDRDTSADIVMRYIDEVELETKNGKYVVKQINFRSTFYNDFNELYTLKVILIEKNLLHTILMVYAWILI